MSEELTRNGDVAQFLQTLISSGKLPPHIKTIEDAYTIAQMGKELGFPPMQAMHYIISIKGKLSLSAKAVGALLKRGGVTYYTKEDALFVNQDGTTSEYKTENVVDRRTTIVFKRGTTEEVCTFTWLDAQLQELTSKDNYRRMPKEMLYARCLAKGANRIAPDLLLGLYMTDVLVDSLNIPEDRVQRGDDGFIKDIDIKEQ